MSVLAVLQAIAVLALLILVHELGHFMAARLQGIHVNRFSIGFGPILWKYQGAETEYAIRGFPLGGFVGFPDDEPDSQIPPDDPNLLRNRPLFDRAIVISAGVIANLVFAYLLLVFQVGIVGIPISSQPGVLIPEIVSQTSSVALNAGIQPKDVILAVNGKDVGYAPNAIIYLKKEIESHANQPLNLTVQRREMILNITVTPQAGEDGKGKIGVGLAPNGEIVRQRVGNIFAAFREGAKEFQRLVTLTAQGFGQLLANFSKNAEQVAGPVKIVAIGANIAQSDAASLFEFAALISINLALINILPLPALDGGQLAFLLVEGLRGKPLPTHIQDGVMQTGLMLILGLGIFLIIRDTSQLPAIQQLFE